MVALETGGRVSSDLSATVQTAAVEDIRSPLPNVTSTLSGAAQHRTVDPLARDGLAHRGEPKGARSGLDDKTGQDNLKRVLVVDD